MHEHDLGLAHDLRVMSRRRMLTLVGVAAAAATAAGCSRDGSGSSATSSPVSDTAATTSSGSSASAAPGAAPQETAGPYPGDGSNGPNVLIESGVVRSDITGSFGSYSGTAEGVPMTLTMTMQDLAKNGAAGAGMAIYVWHCTREGEYSLYGVEDQNYLRGVQVADDSGTVTFTSIFPACYSGRWPHIHFEVFDSLTSAVAGENARLTSQIALPQEACDAVYAADRGYAQSVQNMKQVSLDSDMVFSDGWTAELATVGGSPSAGTTVSITVGVADKSQNTEAPMPGGGPGGSPPGGGPGGNGGPPPGR